MKKHNDYSKKYNASALFIANAYSFCCSEKCVPLQGKIRTTTVERIFLCSGTNKHSLLHSLAITFFFRHYCIVCTK